MAKFITERRLTVINIVIVSYFAFLYIVNALQLDFILIGFFREFLTIPFLISEIVFLVIGSIMVLKSRTSFNTRVSIALLAICAGFTIGSLI